MNEPQSAVSILILLLLVASTVAMATKWVRLPYTLALVIVGLIISPMHFLPPVHFSPDIMLLIFLPALLFEAAWNLNLRRLRANLLPILLLAIPGVVISVGTVALVLHQGIGLPFRTALLFGAIVSATDPVSVLALFRRFGLPPRLSTIVESESLFNDGTAVVVFNIVLGLVIGTTAGSPGMIALVAVRQFAVVVFGGLAVGAIVGLIGSTITSYIDDHLLEITLTTIASYGSYLLADSVGVSAVIAVLVAGLVLGNYGRQQGMSATTQLAVSSFWEYAAFVVNSLVFLLIGLEVHVSMLADNIIPIAWAVLAILLGRLVSVYGLVPLSNRISRPMAFRWMHVLFWGGLRGALSIALVLSLPPDVPHRAQLVSMVFGTVIFSLLVQGLSMSQLLKWLGFNRTSEALADYELSQARVIIAGAAIKELDRMNAQGLLTKQRYEAMRTDAERSEQEASERVYRMETSDRGLEQQEVSRVRQRLLEVQKARLSALLRDSVISEDTYRAADKQLDIDGKDLDSETESIDD